MGLVVWVGSSLLLCSKVCAGLFCGKVGEPFCTFVLIDGLINFMVEVWNERIRGVDGADGVTFN